MIHDNHIFLVIITLMLTASSSSIKTMFHAKTIERDKLTGIHNVQKVCSINEVLKACVH
jgi:hypothetical protein